MSGGFNMADFISWETGEDEEEVKQNKGKFYHKQ